MQDYTDRISQEQHYQELRRQIQECRTCQELFGYEPRPILFGNVDARIMQISQAPSRKVHETGRKYSCTSNGVLRLSSM